MTRFVHAHSLAHASVLQHPERLHPLLWRGTQLAKPVQKTVSTGYSELDAQLPGRGWPAGDLIEIMLPRSGIGEIQLLKPALLSLADERSIIFLNPPYIPSSLCVQQWFPSSQRILWIKADCPRNTLWVAEKILRHNTCAALLCWVNKAHPASLHRLHLAARQSETLFFSLRPATCAMRNSIAPLRLALEPDPRGLDIWLLKRRGPYSDSPVRLTLHNLHTHQRRTPALHHETLDQRLSDQFGARPRHVSTIRRNGHAAIYS